MPDRDSIRRTLVDTEPVLPGATVDPREREWAVGQDSSAEAALDFLTTESNTLADQLESVGASAWNRKAKIAGSDRTVTALDLAREAARTGSEHLRAAEAAIEYARRH